MSKKTKQRDTHIGRTAESGGTVVKRENIYPPDKGLSIYAMQLLFGVGGCKLISAGARPVGEIEANPQTIKDSGAEMNYEERNLGGSRRGRLVNVSAYDDLSTRFSDTKNNLVWLHEQLIAINPKYSAFTGESFYTLSALVVALPIYIVNRAHSPYGSGEIPVPNNLKDFVTIGNGLMIPAMDFARSTSHLTPTGIYIHSDNKYQFNETGNRGCPAPQRMVEDTIMNLSHVLVEKRKFADPNQNNLSPYKIDMNDLLLFALEVQQCQDAYLTFQNTIQKTYEKKLMDQRVRAFILPLQEFQDKLNRYLKRSIHNAPHISRDTILYNEPLLISYRSKTM